MTRVGTCQDCGAKYKIPDSVKATKAKCKKCEGVVVIPPAAAAAGVAPTSKPAAAPRAKTAAPSKSAAAPTKRAPAAKSAKSARSGAKRSGGASKSKRTSGGRSGGKSKRGGSKDSKSPLPMVLGIVALIAIAFGVWWFAFRDDGTAANTTDTTVATSDDGTDTDAGTDAAAEAPAPAAAAAPAPDDANDGDDAAAAAAPAAAPAATAKPVDDGPYDPVITFDEVPPVPGTTAEQVAAWQTLLHDTFLDPPHPKVQKQMIAELEEIDIVDMTPAIMNSLRGLDISDSITIRDSYELVKWWQNRTANTPQFTWVGDATRTGQDDIDLKIKTINSLTGWWNGYNNDAEKLDQLREKIADRLASQG